MKKTKNNISFEIRICNYESKNEEFIDYKGKESVYLNDIEYYRIKKFLESEYGLMTEFIQLDKEIKQVEKLK